MYRRRHVSARILKVVKLSGDNVNLIIQGLKRVRVDRFRRPPSRSCKAAVTPLHEVTETADVELEALVRSLVNQFQRLVQVSSNISSDLGEMVLSAGSGIPARLSDLAASVLNISAEEKIGLLERNNVKDRTSEAGRDRHPRARAAGDLEPHPVAGRGRGRQDPAAVLPARADEGDPA